MKPLIGFVLCLTFAASCPFAQTVTWERQEPVSRPAAGPGPAMAFQDHLGTALLLQWVQSLNTCETWTWDGLDWTRREPQNRPSPRWSAAMAYDPVRRRVLLFGGNDGAPLDDTWEWDGTNWEQRFPTRRPPPRSWHRMVFDPIRGRMVLFGGAGDGLFHGDTWLWSGSDWTLVATEGPVPRAYHGMAWDETRGVILLFGGSAWPSTSLNDTWEWDGASWLDVSAPGSPSARRYHALVGHPVRGRVVLSGGWTLPGGMLDDTWEWDGARRTWSPVLPRATIGGRFQHQVVYDRWRSRLVAFGGFYTGLVNETWTFLELHLDAIPPQPAAGQSVAFMLASARDPGVPYVLAASFARAPGLPVHPDGRVLSLARDPLFDWSAGALLPPFLGFQGALDASGRTKAAVEIPPVPALAGLRFYVAGVAYDPQFVRTVFTEIEVRVR